MNEGLPTLLFPFERGILDVPQAGQRVLVLGAGAGFRMPDESAADVVAVQDFRPDHLALVRSGIRTVAEAGEGGFDLALVLLSRHRRENERLIGEALARVKPGGLIVAAGTKKDGAPSFAKRIGGIVPVAAHMSKYHGVVFWIVRPEEISTSVLEQLRPEPLFTPEGFETASGGFSEGRIDEGSRLLLECLPEKLVASAGRVADFCAGWGYLAVEIAKQYEIAGVDLYEAHKRSLDAAERNFARMAPGKPARFFWHDLATEPVAERYDAIVMNPPFHQSRSAQPELGQAMIRVAAGALKPGGRLFLVANRGLPYEAVFKEHFADHGEIRRNDTYKVLWGRR